jgi:hypothetical protein
VLVVPRVFVYFSSVVAVWYSVCVSVCVRGDRKSFRKMRNRHKARDDDR